VDRPPNVLLVTMDTTRADHCSLYGYEVETTPNLTRLAAEGARFDLAYSPTSTTGPTHATIFTGLYALTHRVVKNGLPLADRFPTLAELLRGEGYQTAAILGSFAMSHRFGYGQGFLLYDDEFTRESSTYSLATWEGHTVGGGFDRRADETTRRAVEWLRTGRAPDRPFLLFVHYFDPHDPYTPPEEYRRERGLTDRQYASDLQRTVAHYDAEISFTDREIGRLLDEMKKSGLEDDTIVIVTGDHGEGLMDHGHMYHGMHIYEESVRVPLVVRWPGRIPRRTFTAPVELVDLLPTIFDLIGRDPGRVSLHGRSLAPALRGDSELDPERPVFLHRRHYAGRAPGSDRPSGQKFGIRTGRWKYIFGPDEGTRELFDLEADPGERTNILDTATDRAREMAARLESWRERHEISNAVGVIPPEDLEKLRVLGYVD
jgi:arylsulfatase A-like enzyme